MSLKTFKPYTKSTRGTILVDRSNLWKGKPFKKLVSPKNSIKKYFFGSKPLSIAQKCNCPVLITK